MGSSPVSPCWLAPFAHPIPCPCVPRLLVLVGPLPLLEDYVGRLAAELDPRTLGPPKGFLSSWLDNQVLGPRSLDSWAACGRAGSTSTWAARSRAGSRAWAARARVGAGSSSSWVTSGRAGFSSSSAARGTAASLAPRGRVLEPLGRPQLGCILELLRRPRESWILEVVGGLQEGWILKFFGSLFILDLLHFNFGSLASCPRFAPQQVPRAQKLKCKRSGMNERTAHRHQVPGRTLLFVFVFSRSSCA